MSVLGDKQQEAEDTRRTLLLCVGYTALTLFLAEAFDSNLMLFLSALGFLGTAFFIVKGVWDYTYYYTIKLKPKDSMNFQYFVITIYPIFLSLFFVGLADEFTFDLFVNELTTLLLNPFIVFVFSGVTWFSFYLFSSNLAPQQVIYFFQAFLMATNVVFILTVIFNWAGGTGKYDNLEYSERGLDSAIFLARVTWCYLTIFAFIFFNKIKFGRER